MSVKLPRSEVTGLLVTLSMLLLVIAEVSDAVVVWCCGTLVLGTLWLSGCSLRRMCHHCDRSVPAAFLVCTSCGRGLRMPNAGRRTRSAG